tara:strand:- start:40 stop:693 length:654 start_codon:yes stop_codon:yes gene_type:complete
MSLIDEAQRNAIRFPMAFSEKASTKDKRMFIVQANELTNILKDEMESLIIDKKARKEFSSYRTQLKTAQWRLSGILNHVDEPLYREQIGKTYEGLLKSITLRQPNGSWKVIDYEVDIRPNAGGEDSIMLAVKFVDIKNETDLKYKNGVPVVDVNVDIGNSNKELIEAIKAQGANSNDQELKDLMKQFIAVMAQDKIAEKSVEKTEEKFEEEPQGFVE